jgi:hypothetical protein
MLPTASDISRDELLAFLRRSGFQISPHQLLRWRNAGLLPQPTRVGLGRGKGTTSFYPKLAAIQARTLAALLRRRRNLPEAGWSLWMFGFPLTAWARAHLLDVLRTQAREAGRAEKALAVKGRLARQLTEQPTKELGQIQKVVRQEAMPQVFRMLMQFQLGGLRAAAYTADDWSLLQDAVVSMLDPSLLEEVELADPDAFADEMERLTRTASLPQVIEAISALPAQRFEQYRNELQWLAERLVAPGDGGDGLVSVEDFVRFFKVRHLNPDGEAQTAALMRALGQDRPPPSALQRWVRAGEAAAEASRHSTLQVQGHQR